MKKMTVAMLTFAAGLLAGSASAAMTHTAATIDTRADVLMDELPEGTPVTPMVDDDGQLVIVLSTNITGSLTIPADLGSVTLDLNGWSIKGTNGVDGTETTFGGNGGAAVIVKGSSGADAGTTAITVRNEPSTQLWENGPYFATCNVGATEPQQSGYFFWWGDTVGYTNNGSAWISVKDGTTSITFNDNSPANSTYNKTAAALQSAGYIDDASNPFLNAAHDAATANLGAPWRLMTYDELTTLTDTTFCTREWKENYKGTGVNGYLVKGAVAPYTNNEVFFPAAGYGKNSGFYDHNTVGLIWCSTLYTADTVHTHYLRFNSDDFYKSNNYRNHGMTVRAVNSDGTRPPTGPGPAKIVGGNGGDGNPPGTGSFAIVDGSGAEYAAVTDPDGLVTKGEDGKNLRDEAVKETFDEPWVVVGPDAGGWYTAILTNDVTGPLEIPDDLGKVKIDLNDWNITGTNGVTDAETSAGTDGGNGIIIVHNESQRCDPSEYWLINEADAEDTTRPEPGTGKHAEGVIDGLVAGGNGGDGNTPGDGAAGILVAEGATPAAVTVGNDSTDPESKKVTVKGGNGGDGLGTDEETGNGTAGGNGGAGIDVGDGEPQPAVTVEDTGDVTGGDGGSGSDADLEKEGATGGDGGNGGAGVDGDVTKNDGTITGGNGGNAGIGGETGGNGGNGGNGVTGSEGEGSGTTTGGNGGNGGDGDKTGGNGGDGGDGNGNDPAAGGNGGNGGNGGDGSDKGGDGGNGGEGDDPGLSGEPGKDTRGEEIRKTFDEPWVVVGPVDGWYTAILTNDVTGPVVIPDDLGKVKIDLNDWNITGTNGVTDAETSAGTDGGNGIIIVHNEPQRFDSSEYWLINEAGSTEPEYRPDPGTDTHGTAGDGVVAGGNGGNGHGPGDGAAGILVADDATPAAVTVGNNEDGSDNTVTVKGGNGGNGLGTDEDGNGIAGGNGGAGIDAGDGEPQPTVKVEETGTVTGGNGGAGSNADPTKEGATGGDGGNGGAGVDGDVEKNDGTITGGDGGNAGIGGDGGQGGKGVDGVGPASSEGTVTDGEDGSTGKLVPQSFWITNHADAGNGKVHLAFQPVFGKAVDITAWIQYARQNGVVHYVTADTEAELANAPLQDVTFRDGTGTQDVAKGWCWVAVPATDKLYKIVIGNGK